jgi:hypothetical protein
MFERLLYHLGLLCFPRDNTVLFYYNILRLSSLFTLRRSILTAVMLGLPLLSLWFFLSERLDLRCSTDIGRIIIRSNYDVRQILGGLLFVPIMMFDRYWFYDLGFSFSLLPHLFSSITQSSVYLHSLRFAGRFSRRLCLGCHFLSLWFFLSERLGWGLGFRTHATLWIFSLPSYLHLRLSSLFTLRRSILTAVMLGLPLFISLLFFHFFYHFSFLTHLL